MKNPNSRTDTLYLVTGVAGNLGSSVAAKLLEEGKNVRGLVLKGDPAAVRVPKEVDIRIGDVVRATEVTRVAIEEGAGARGKGHGVNRVLDDALEAFIDVLDRHTIADMVRSQTASEGRVRARTVPAARSAALRRGRPRRSLHGGG